MAKFPEWIDSWKNQYKEDMNSEVLKAEIKMILKKPNGEIAVWDSEYKSENFPKIKIVKESAKGSVVCG
ncbi:MAG: hypothetical protein A2471_01015 [Omnitrophica WOR_2 bacterium RIFOXYC2_FULL_45_15]|nr:MAG: hypothetical protein A2471_01015 [Omnitrophica WOR_2 bacterium RIFOXYC2_FULL_45_15]